MVGNINIFNFEKAFKLFKEGKIDKSYLNIFSQAEEIADHELEQEEEIRFRENEQIVSSYEEAVKFFRRMLDFKRERTNFHVERMLKMLSERYKEKDE